MKKFKVFVRGKNYLLQEAETSPRKFGFYTTVFVEARNVEEAEAHAIDVLRADPKLSASIQNQESDPPVLVVESAEQIASFAGCRLPRLGLSMHAEDRVKID